MITTAAIVGGLVAGLLIGKGRAPRRQTAFLVAGLLVLAALLGLLALDQFVLLNALLACVAAVAGATGYAASVWKRQMPDLEISWGGWAWRELLHPRYVREQFQQLRE